MNYPAPHDPLVGKTFDGRFRIVARIGEGGMGVVYRAVQSPGNQTVAIKMLSSTMASDPEWVQRFYNEAKACSQLRHPNTIKMFEFGQANTGELFMTMEFLDGPSLRQVIATSAPMPAVRVVSILAQACSSLEEAHNLSIVHRDIKPDNLFVLPTPRPDFVKVLDFSVAKLVQDGAVRTQAGIVFGTPEYMAPETARGQTKDPRSDLYSLGILGYEMLTGKPPFDGPNPMAVLAMHTSAALPPLPPTVATPAASVVLRALEKDPSRRFQSSTEMREACEAAIHQLVGLPARRSGMQSAAPQIAAPPMTAPRSSAAMATPGQTGAPRTASSAMKRTMIASSVPVTDGAPPPAQRSAERTLYQDASGLGGGPPPPVGGPPPAAAPLPGQHASAIGSPPPQAPATPSQAPPGQAASPQQRTLYAAQNPLQQQGAPPSSGSQSAVKSTVVASASSGAPMQPFGGPPSMPTSNPQPAVQQGSPPAAVQQGGVKKTMMLNPSEGVVSFAGSQPTPPPMMEPVREGATALFWIVSLTIGAAIGVGAYLVVLAAS